jgi:hypothetical protein
MIQSMPTIVYAETMPVIQKLALSGTDYRSWDDVGKSFENAVSYRNIERKARGKRFRDTQMRRRKLRRPLWTRH